ncbi:PREDICTED: protein PHLOEM PROTEIN 2-LIKE A10-like [Camelina sativa]|uniref:Protein PHLOEM PROTEIN 2-LIKE A10-like n=1 Tax=Camelina sativa TaxID=90675 RepID=A0ABM0YNJ4_CAMSA|nr:PREDICTED: protein PHLOEM PROTEIN 2-LIKE A10-like [Camelina sativa]
MDKLGVLSKKRSYFDFALKNKKWILLAVSGYAAFRVYHSPSVTQKRKRISKLFSLLLNLVEAASDSAEAVSVISKDLTEFLRSDSDQIPNSFKQISKIAKSDELNSSLIRFTQAMTVGLIRGIDDDDGSGSGFTNRVLDKLFTKSGSGFASAIVGSFARNLVVAFYSSSSSGCGGGSPKLFDAICSDDGRRLIGDCVQRFVTTAVSVYLDKTSDVNVFDDLFAGLTNPKHEDKVKQTLVTVCNNAVETFVRASRKPVQLNRCQDSSQSLTVGSTKQQTTWIDRVSSSLSVPSNRKYVVDLTGRVTFETVRSLLEVLIERANGKVESYVEKVRERGNETRRFVRVKTSLLHSLCLSLCLQIVEAPWILTPRN